MIALAALFACSGPVPLQAGDAARPDVLLISIDTLRADHVGAYGYERGTTPRLDALAASGARFSQAWSPSPWTLPSHATMLTGRLPRHHGAIEGDRSIGPGIPRLPAAFRDAGYASIGVVSTLYVSRKFGFDEGFDAFVDFGIDDEKKNLSGEVRAEQVFAEVLRLAREQAPGKPVFAFVHVYDVHYAYEAPSPWDERFDRKTAPGDARYKRYSWYAKHPLAAEQLEHQKAQYDEEIAYVDDQLGAFVDRWRASRPAYVAVTADHGEEFGERGSWGHAHTLYPEQLHVPWVVSGPDVPAAVIEGRVGGEDVAASLAGLAHVTFDAGDGTDRSPQLRGGPYDGARPAARFAETSRFDTNRVRWHEPPYDLYADLKTGALSLCDLAKDPTCRDDAAHAHPETAFAMEGALFEWLGAPWTVKVAGKAHSDGVFAVWGRRIGTDLQTDVGARFLLWPPDAAVTYTDAAGDHGPWRALGGPLPGAADALAYEGASVDGGGVTLDDAQKKALEALGYVQE